MEKILSKREALIGPGLSLFLRVCLPIELLLVAAIEWRGINLLPHTYEQTLVRTILWGLPLLVVSLAGYEMFQDRPWKERYAAFWKVILIEVMAIFVITGLAYRP